MQPPSSSSKAHETSPAFTEAAESWLRRTRDPRADSSVLNAVQRWQEQTQPAISDAGEVSIPEATSSSAYLASHAVLRRMTGEQKNNTWHLTSDRPLLIGRSGKRTAQVDVDLWPDGGISRLHAMLWFDGKGWLIEDLRSKNGTFIDEQDIRGQRAVQLAPGMSLRLGRTVLLLAIDPAADQSAAEPMPESQETEAPTLET